LAAPEADSNRDPCPSDEQCRALVERILASPELRRATRLRGFLTYVVDRKLAGRPEEITETLIGHRVFGRSPTYNAGEDSIVRTEARTLRQRLERYFSGAGASEPVILEIPRGGYVPVFRPRAAVAPSQAAPSAPTGTRVHLTRRQCIAIGAPALALAGAAAWRGIRSANSAGTAAGVSPTRLPGEVQLESSDPRLTAAFLRSKQRALSCVYTGDPVGDWYATSPAGRSTVFCMRDVAHQSIGAAVLGLNRHTANMLRRFAQAIASSRDFCSYWMITKDGFPDPATYNDDTDFGYSLPANFDILRACYREFLWTGDTSYLNETFSGFYDRTVVNYVQAWDRDHDGIMKNSIRPRVTASYHQEGPRFLTGADLIAGQYAGYLTYAAFEEVKGKPGSLSRRVAQEYRNRAAGLRARFNTEWWDPRQNRFCAGTFPDRSFSRDSVPDCNTYVLWFGIPEDGPKTDATFNNLQAAPPQSPGALSHLPELLYRYGRRQQAHDLLLEIADPEFFGQHVSETAFAVVGAVATGLMGIAPDAPNSKLETLPCLPESLPWARLSRVPALKNEITVAHRGLVETTFTNSAGPLIEWKAAFPVPQSGRDARILVDGVPAAVSFEQRANRQTVIAAVVPVEPGKTRTAKYSA
jgi:hypothetical protein